MILKRNRRVLLKGSYRDPRQTIQASDEMRLKRLISTAVEMRLKFYQTAAVLAHAGHRTHGLEGQGLVSRGV